MGRSELVDFLNGLGLIDLQNAELNFGLNTILFSKRHGSIMVEATIKLQTSLERYNFQDSKFKFCFPMALTVSRLLVPM